MLSHTKRLAISAAAGVAAFVGNQLYLAGAVRQESFVSTLRSVPAGQPLTERDLAPLSLSGDLGRLRATAIPWSERAVVFESRPVVGLAEGDLLLRQQFRPAFPVAEIRKGEFAVQISTRGLDVVSDLLRVGDFLHVVVTRDNRTEEDADSELEFLGPFRIAAVDQRVAPDESASDARRGSQPVVLTLAVPLDASGGRESTGGAYRLSTAGRTLMQAARSLDGYRVIQISTMSRNS